MGGFLGDHLPVILIKWSISLHLHVQIHQKSVRSISVIVLKACLIDVMNFCNFLSVISCKQKFLRGEGFEVCLGQIWKRILFEVNSLDITYHKSNFAYGYNISIQRTMTRVYQMTICLFEIESKIETMIRSLLYWSKEKWKKFFKIMWEGLTISLLSQCR